MSRDLARILFIEKMIASINLIVTRHGGVAEALADEVEGQKALLMCLQQIGETLNKLSDPEVTKFFEPLDIKGAYDVRTFIAHDYLGVNLLLIERIIHEKIPVFAATVRTILNGEPAFTE